MTEKMTPMMRQYHSIKKEMPEGVILFFRLGDFYEMFYEDASVAAPILDIALTKRNGMPMCGVPFHAVDSYLAKLIRAGKRVAICEQVEDASAAKGIVKREVTRVVTPGTVTEDSILESNEHNFLAGLYRSDDTFGMTLLDLSTGRFEGEELPTAAALRDAVRRFAPSECVVSASQAEDADLRQAAGSNMTTCEDWSFSYDEAHDQLTRHFGVKSLEGFGCEGNHAIVCAAGGVVGYVTETLRHSLEHVRGFRVRRASDFLVLDPSACENLDLVPVRGKPVAATVQGVLDTTRTAMGGRMLRDWILRPLADLVAIQRRHDVVAAFHADRILLNELREALGGIRDLERLIVRIGNSGGSGRDLVAVAHSLDNVPAVRTLIADAAPARLQELTEAIVLFPELVELVQTAIVDEPPLTVKEGGVIRDGYHAELDELRAASSEGKAWLARYQATERERTGIKTLKVRHNKVFGYYLEVSKAQLDNVPDTYVRKQTLVNAERFITPELKEYENRIVGAQDRAMALEYELFTAVRDQVAGRAAEIQDVAAALAELDVLTTLAERAMTLRYVRPVMTGEDALKVTGGRHPVVEQVPDAEPFVPNDTLLDGTQNQLAIITGPNMAGKSTYIRQVALIVIMAHMGSFVPAEAAEIAVVDRVFTRVGASDDLAGGRSTFMVEMEETANILNNATPRSLIVLDEIGRGTSTFDGISIAWAVAEYLHGHAPVKAKTLFATHYHELTDLAMTMPGVKNYNIQVHEKDDHIVFLRRIAEGPADKSYGIQVARLAGMPSDVVERSKEILANLEDGEFGETGQPKIARRRPSRRRDNDSQMDLFGGLRDPSSP